jgi:hypothetical protein
LLRPAKPTLNAHLFERICAWAPEHDDFDITVLGSRDTSRRQGHFERRAEARSEARNLAASSSAQLEQSHSDDQGVSDKSRNEFHDPIFDSEGTKTIQPSTYILLSARSIVAVSSEQ